MQQVEDIAVRIGKEDQGVSMCRLRIGKKTHTFALQAGVDEAIRAGQAQSDLRAGRK